MEVFLKGLTFEEGSHIYRLDGKEIPSVSKILSPLSKSAYDAIPMSVLNAAADRGTAVHEAIENFSLFGEECIYEEFKGYFDSYKDWFDKNNPEIMLSESKGYHPVMLYAGTIDCVCKIGDDVCLVDYKTSSRVLDKNYRIQLEAYRQILHIDGIEITKKMVLHLTPSGWSEHLYKVNDAEAWRVFGALKCIYDYTIGS